MSEKLSLQLTPTRTEAGSGGRSTSVYRDDYLGSCTMVEERDPFHHQDNGSIIITDQDHRIGKDEGFESFIDGL